MRAQRWSEESLHIQQIARKYLGRWFLDDYDKKRAINILAALRIVDECIEKLCGVTSKTIPTPTFLQKIRNAFQPSIPDIRKWRWNSLLSRYGYTILTLLPYSFIKPKYDREPDPDYCERGYAIISVANLKKHGLIPEDSTLTILHDR